MTQSSPHAHSQPTLLAAGPVGLVGVPESPTSVGGGWIGWSRAGLDVWLPLALLTVVLAGVVGAMFVRSRERRLRRDPLAVGRSRLLRALRFTRSERNLLASLQRAADLPSPAALLLCPSSMRSAASLLGSSRPGVREETQRLLDRLATYEAAR